MDTRTSTQRLDDALPELREYKNSFSSKDIEEDKEWRKWLEFIFLLYLSGIFPIKPYESISCDIITPHGWNIRDMFNHLKWYIEHNIGTILYQYISIDSDKNDDIDTFDFFEDYNFLTKYTNIDKYQIEFYKEKPAKLIQNMFDEMAYINFWTYQEFWKYKKTMSTIDSIFESHYRIYGNEFDISQKSFLKYDGLEFMNTIILLYFSGLIHITWIWWEAEDGVSGRECYYVFGIRMTEKYKYLMASRIQEKDLIIKNLYDEGIKKFSVSKKQWKPHMLEGEREIIGDNTRFVDILKKYPHSKIESNSYNGKINKYTVTEKIKLSKNEQK